MFCSPRCYSQVVQLWVGFPQVQVRVRHAAGGGSQWYASVHEMWVHQHPHVWLLNVNRHMLPCSRDKTRLHNTSTYLMFWRRETEACGLDPL